MKGKKTLVAYYSATGNTERAAKLVAEATGGTLYAIRPAQPYTAAHLDWHDQSSRSTREMADPQSRPAIVGDLEQADSYEVVYIGFPIWWDEAPRVVNTFIDKYGFEGCTVIPFATSGGSGIDHAVKTLRQSYPGLHWQPGRLLNRASLQAVEAWVKE